MAPRGRKPKVGLRRENAARDNMRQFGFEELVINKTIKELVQLYGEDGWKLIEDGGYDVLLTRCLEIQEEEAKQVSQVEQEEPPQEEETHDLAQHEHQVEEGRDHVGSSNSTSLVRCGSAVETGTRTCQADAFSITNEAAIASPDCYAHGSVRGALSSQCGWLSSEEEEEEETNLDKDCDGMIKLTPEPLCEELKELVREVRGKRKRKRPAKLDDYK